jgi:hypothetical protein
MTNEEKEAPEWLQRLRRVNPDAAEYRLNEIIYAEPAKGEDYKLYRYGADGYHSGAQWFTSGQIKYADEQIAAIDAKRLAEETMREGHEVRITDTSDYLVFRAVEGRQVHPPENVDFWSQV